MLLIILSILDVVVGAAIYSQSAMLLISGFALALAFIILAKGLWFFFTTYMTSGIFYTWSSALDIAAGIALILITYNMLSASHILGGIVMLKGGWYLTRSILKF